MEKINFEEISFGVITYSGKAKSSGMIAIKLAKEGKIDQARKLISDGEKSLVEAEKKHMIVIQQEAQGVKHHIPVLFIHAEDQMMTSQIVLELAKEFIDLYEKLLAKKVI